MTLEPVLLAVEITAVIAFAISGLIEAVRKRMDIVGTFTVAFVTAFGGGTLRDVLLDRRPLVWVAHQEYIWLVLALALVVPWVVVLLRHQWVDWTLKISDALGLGLFAASGASLALAAGMPLIVIVMMGVITGVFGGVLRDVLCNEIPAVFYDHQPYAVCAFHGSWVLVVLHWLDFENWVGLLACVGVTTGLRLCALLFGWRLPAWPRSSN